jgi:hypothetical protein
MRIADALDLLSWPLVLARAATAGLGARVDPIARVVSRRLGRQAAGRPPDGDDRHHAPPEGDLRARAEAARFWLAPSSPPEPPAVAGALLDPEPGELPAAYGVDRVVLVARDPWWLYAFWEVTPESRERARAALGEDAPGARPVLRVHDVTALDPAGGEPGPSLDVEVEPDAPSWYVNVGRPGASYRAEIGLRTEAGRFLPLAGSNTAATPPAMPSPDTEVRWLAFGPTGPAWPGPSRGERPPPGGGTAATDDQRVPG